MQIKFSVIIPVYNAEATLERCLNSVINQSYPNWEIIAIDDGSKDNSYLILNEYTSKDQRIICESQLNQGPGVARNKAMNKASGDYIVFLDADDYVENLYFKSLSDRITSDESDVIFVDVIQERPNGKFIKKETMSKFKNFDKESLIRFQMTGKLPWGGWRKVVKKSIIDQNNIRYSSDAVGEEALYSFRILSAARHISFLEMPFYHYVNYPQSQSKKGDEDPWGDVVKNMKAYLIENDLYNDYYKTINSFAMTALIISIDRLSKRYNLVDSISHGKTCIEKFEANYSYDMDNLSLDNKALLMAPLVKWKILPCVIAISKIRNKIIMWKTQIS